MARIFDGATVTVALDMKTAISDAMHGKANDILKILNGEDLGDGRYPVVEIYDSDTYTWEPIKATVYNAGMSNNILDYIVTFVSKRDTNTTTSAYLSIKNSSGNPTRLFQFSFANGSVKYKSDEVYKFEVRIAV